MSKSLLTAQDLSLIHIFNYSRLSRAAREDVEYFDEISQEFVESIKDNEGITADGVAMGTLENLTNAMSALRDSVDYDQVVTCLLYTSGKIAL